MKIEVNKVPRLLGIGLFYGFWLLGLAGYLTHLLTGAMPDPIAFAPLALFDGLLVRHYIAGFDSDWRMVSFSIFRYAI